MEHLVAQVRPSLNSFLGKGGGHHHGGHYHHHDRDLYYPETYFYPLPDSSVDDEVIFHEHQNDCIVIRRGSGPTQVRQVVIDKLKSRGWAERMSVDQEGSFNVKTLLLCPPGAASGPRVSRIHMTVGSHLNDLGYVNLSQASQAKLRVIVMDRRGQPGPGIPVVVVSDTSGNIGEGETDNDGVFEADISTGMEGVTIIATLPEGEVRERVMLAPLGATVATIRSIRKIGPFITLAEAGIGIGGIAVATLGLIIKNSVFTMIGEGAFFAAVFSKINRG
jgi:hypothetical protein